MCMAGCTSAVPPPQAATQAAIPTETPTRVAAAPTDPAILTEPPHPTAAPSQTETPTNMDPLIKSKLPLGALGWSPDGAWIAYRDYGSQKDRLYQVSTARTCDLTTFPDTLLEGGGHPSWDWLADGRILVISAGRATLGAPCDDAPKDITSVFPHHPAWIESINPTHTLFILSVDLTTAEQSAAEPVSDLYLYDTVDGSLWSFPAGFGGRQMNFSWSPDSKYLTVIGNTDTHPNGHVWVVDTDSGQTVRTIDMVLQELDAAQRAPQWINDTQFVIRESWSRGPLLVTMNGAVEDIPKDLFHVPFTNDDCAAETGSPAFSCWMDTTALGFASAAGGHVVWQPAHLQLPGAADLPTRFVYHGERNDIESISQLGEVHVSPDGQWMLLWNPEDSGALALYLRPVDPPGGDTRMIEQWEPLRKGGYGANLLEWSSDSHFFAVANLSDRSIEVYSVPDGQEVAHVAVHGYTLGMPTIYSADRLWMASGVWSPDGKSLLVPGETASKRGGVLIVLKLP